MRKFLLLLLGCFLLPASYAVTHPKTEIRAVWLTTHYGLDWPKVTAKDENSRIAQQKELCAYLDKLKAANFNVVFLQTRLRGDVIYPSSIESFNRIFSGRYGVSPGYDPLAFAIEECHKRGMECHAWFVTYPLGNAKKRAVMQKPTLCKYFGGEWHLDPGVPETNDYILSLVKEIVTRYDIDGIHFDYIRYPENAESFPDDDTYRRYGKGMGKAAWRRDNINRLMTRVYDWVKQAKPWVQVSSSPLGKYNRIPRVPNAGWTAYESVHQDPQLWMKQGKHDMIAPMMYYRNELFYPFVDDWQENSNGRFFIPGLGVYRMTEPKSLWQVSEITRQLDYVRTTKAAGNAFFRGTEILQNTKGIYDILKNTYYKYPALLPPMTWLSATKPNRPTQVKAERIGNQIRISWTCQPTDNQPLTYTLYYSRSSNVNTQAVQSILVTGLRENEAWLNVKTDKEQEFTFCVTSSNRYHLESEPSRKVYFYYSHYIK